MSELARIEPIREVEPVERRADTDSWIRVVAEVSKLASMVASTDFVPRVLRDSAPAVAAAILYGREVGLPPMTALTQVNVIEGRPSLAAEGMRALVLAAGHDLVFVESTGAVCTMRGRRHGSTEWTSLTWTLDMARAAGLLPGRERSAWRTYPRSMLQARCTTELCRMVFPDVIHGFRSVEEMEDTGPVGAVGGAVEIGTGAPRTTTTVQRATGQRPRKKAAAAPPAETPPAEAGPPLPGEAGYEEDSEVAAPNPAAATSDPIEEQVTPRPPLDTDGGEDPSPSPTSPPSPEERMITRPQLRFMFQFFGKLGLGDLDADRDERLRLTGLIVGRPIDSSAQLTLAEGQKVIDTLALAGTSLADLHAIIEGTPPPTPPPDPAAGPSKPSDPPRWWDPETDVPLPPSMQPTEPPDG